MSIPGKLRASAKYAAAFSACFLLLAGLSWAALSASERPQTWAHPLPLQGVENLYRVCPDLYRSKQPRALGLENLKKMGLKTVVNLRAFHSDAGKLGNTGLSYEHISMKPWHPEEEDAVRFLRIATDPTRTPVLVHCQHGADRTGAMVALYRMAVQGWTREEAIREMTQGGFGFHTTWENLAEWLRKIDIDRIKREAGLK